MMLKKNIEYLRKVSNLTDDDLAQFLGMSVADYLSLTVDNVQLDTIEALSDLYGVEPYDLLTIDLSKAFSEDSSVGESGFVTKPVAYDFRPTTNDLKEIAHFHCLVRNYVKMSKLLSETD